MITAELGGAESSAPVQGVLHYPFFFCMCVCALHTLCLNSTSTKPVLGERFVNWSNLIEGKMN